MAFSSKLLSFLAGGLFTATTALIPAAHAQEIDLSPEQKGRVRAEKVEEAIKLLPAGHKFVADGKLTVATVPFRLPLVDYASDTKRLLAWSRISPSWLLTVLALNFS